MFRGFKEFLMRGNVIDLATAVVVGSAFTAIVTAFTSNIVNPIVASFGGATSTDGLGFRILANNPDTFVDFGAVITAVINFVIVAAVVYFLFIVPMNKLQDLKAQQKGQDAQETKEASEKDLLIEIRDLLAASQGRGPKQ